MNARKTRKPVRLRLEYGEVILALLADVDGSHGQLPLLAGETVGHRRLTPIERLAVDELRAQVLGAARFRS